MPRNVKAGLQLLSLEAILLFQNASLDEAMSVNAYQRNKLIWRKQMEKIQFDDNIRRQTDRTALSPPLWALIADIFKFMIAYDTSHLSVLLLHDKYIQAAYFPLFHSTALKNYHRNRINLI